MKKILFMILMLLSLLTAEAKYYRLVTNIDELLTPGNTFIMVNSGYGEGLPYVARHFDGNRILTESSSLFSLPGIQWNLHLSKEKVYPNKILLSITMVHIY